MLFVKTGGDLMQEYMSRSERRLKKLRSAAQKGNMSLDNELLYGSEIKRLEKLGFMVFHSQSSINNLDTSKIDWSNAFGSEIPYAVSYYINGIISLFPESDIKTIAQELYTIAARVNNEKNNNLI